MWSPPTMLSLHDTLPPLVTYPPSMSSSNDVMSSPMMSPPATSQLHSMLSPLPMSATAFSPCNIAVKMCSVSPHPYDISTSAQRIISPCHVYQILSRLTFHVVCYSFFVFGQLNKLTMIWHSYFAGKTVINWQFQTIKLTFICVVGYLPLSGFSSSSQEKCQFWFVEVVHKTVEGR